MAYSTENLTRVRRDPGRRPVSLAPLARLAALRAAVGLPRVVLGLALGPVALFVGRVSLADGAALLAAELVVGLLGRVLLSASLEPLVGAPLLLGALHTLLLVSTALHALLLASVLLAALRVVAGPLSSSLAASLLSALLLALLSAVLGTLPAAPLRVVGPLLASLLAPLLAVLLLGRLLGPRAPDLVGTVTALVDAPARLV